MYITSTRSYESIGGLKTVLLPVVAVVLLGLTPHGALAENELEEVIVQAERRDASLQATPVAVTALTQRALDQSDIVDITNLNNIAPNLVIQTPADQANVRIFLRGIGTVNGTEVADQSVGFYVDGIFAARSQGALALFYDLESVQLLRGPQGTLFGRNNSAGALLLRTKRPGDELAGEFELTTGSFDRRRFSGGISIPLTDNWGLRLAAVSDRDAGWINQQTTDPRFPVYPHLNPEDGSPSNPYSLSAVNRYADPDLELNNRNVWSARLTSHAQFNDWASWFLSFETYSNQSADSLLLNPVLIEAGKYEAYIDSPHSLDLTTDVVRSVFTMEMGDSAKFEWLLGGARLDRAQVYDNDSGLASRYQENRTEYQETVSGSSELKFSGSYREGVLDWTAGLYGFLERTGIRFDIDAIGGWPEGAGTFIQPERGAEAYAAYAQFTYRPVERLGLTLGFRFTEESKYDRRGRNYGNACNGFVLRPDPASASELNGGNDIATAEDFFNNETGKRTRNLNGSVIDKDGNPPDGIDDVTGQVIPTFTDAFNNATQTKDTPDDDKAPDGLDDVTGEPNTLSLHCVASTQNELEKDDSELTWLARVDYTVGNRNKTLLYLSVGTGYQSGIIQDNGNSTDPEKSLSYEIGTKSDFNSAGDGLRLNTALFFTQYDDLIRSLIDPIQNNTIVTNASEAQIFGAEIEMTSLFGGGGKLDLGLSFLDANYTGQYLFATSTSADLPRGPNPDLPLMSITGADGEVRQFYDLDGNTLPYAPTFQVNFGFSWDIALKRVSLIPRLRGIYSAEYFFSDSNPRIQRIGNLIGGVNQGDGLPDPYFRGNVEGQDAYFKVDIGLELVNDKGWSVDFFINNVTDELTRTSTDCGVATTRSGCAGRYLPPRTYGMRFRMVFE